ncbi:hypothetical protein chiPu_0017475 [Chiloscyllium punctatum]|uniref:RING-type E3 ubiquitin transferase n=1 Tax=Chiloscyllium punctatum TaxID=137246 RepID=A0A401RGA3_CHIPU|nr:hypothetical protein [Chiloscyllium punctatum]
MAAAPVKLLLTPLGLGSASGSGSGTDSGSRSLRTANGCSVKVLECGVCEDVFSLQGDKVPRLLLCGHTVCHDCLTRLPLQGRTIRCPFDRQVTELGDSGVWGLKKNFALLELLERLQNGTANHHGASEEVLEISGERIIRCDEDESHIASMYCTVCATHLCADCSQLTHSTRTLAKHRRVPLADKPHEKTMCSQHQVHEVATNGDSINLEEYTASVFCDISKCVDDVTVSKTITSCPNQKPWMTAKVCVLLRTRDSAFRAADKAALATARANVSPAVKEAKGASAQRNAAFFRTAVICGACGKVQGSAENARSCVRAYFAELHETLFRQEEMALSVVDAHVREKLIWLKQQQEDMTILLSQVSTACLHCEKTLQQDDCRVVMAKQEITHLLETLQKQQQQFTELADHIQLDASIPVTFTKDNRVHIGPKMEIRVVTLGLDGAGKTTILFKLKQDEFMQPIPTIGFNVETVEYKNLKFTIWDVGGKHKLRPLWKHYYLNTQDMRPTQLSCLVLGEDGNDLFLTSSSL